MQLVSCDRNIVTLSKLESFGGGDLKLIEFFKRDSEKFNS